MINIADDDIRINASYTNTHSGCRVCTLLSLFKLVLIEIKCLIKGYAVSNAAGQNLVLTSRVVLCDLDNFKLRLFRQVTPTSSYAPVLQSADRPFSKSLPTHSESTICENESL